MHEQENAKVKGDGGAVGLTENPAALRRWMIAGPEIARVINEFERDNPKCDPKHHEQNPHVQTTFVNQVSSLVKSITDMGNPFEEESQDLINLATQNIASSDTVKCLKSIEKTGQDQYSEYTKNRLVES